MEPLLKIIMKKTIRLFNAKSTMLDTVVLIAPHSSLELLKRLLFLCDEACDGSAKNVVAQEIFRRKIS